MCYHHIVVYAGSCLEWYPSCRALIPSAKEQPEIVIHDAGHFLQEDKGEEIAQQIVDFIART